MSPLLFALFLATFAIGTTEFAVVGLLPDIAASLDTSISKTGLLVSGYAIGVAVGEGAEPIKYNNAETSSACDDAGSLAASRCSQRSRSDERRLPHRTASIKPSHGLLVDARGTAHDLVESRSASLGRCSQLHRIEVVTTDGVVTEDCPNLIFGELLGIVPKHTL